MGAQLASRTSGATESAEIDTTESSTRIDALWLATLERICNRAAHEVKGALNGVAVNVEVVRSRAERPDAQASAVRPFAGAAADQLEVVIGMTDALLFLARPAHAPVELAATLRRFDALLGPAARADGRRLELADTDDLGNSVAGGSAVRLAMGGALLAATSASAHVRCSSVAGEAGLELCLENCDGGSIAIDPELVAAVAAAGIRVRAEASAILIRFPR
jgi:hypothetical protein